MGGVKDNEFWFVFFQKEGERGMKGGIMRRETDEQRRRSRRIVNADSNAELGFEV